MTENLSKKNEVTQDTVPHLKQIDIHTPTISDKLSEPPKGEPFQGQSTSLLSTTQPSPHALATNSHIHACNLACLRRVKQIDLLLRLPASCSSASKAYGIHDASTMPTLTTYYICHQSIPHAKHPCLGQRPVRRMLGLAWGLCHPQDPLTSESGACSVVCLRLTVSETGCAS